MKNKYIIQNNIVKIILKRRKGDDMIGLIDLDDLDKLKNLNLSWHTQWCDETQSYYVKSTKYLGIIDGKPKYKTIYLHRVISEAKKEDIVDHKNFDTLDNRKENLQITTSLNNTKKKSRKNSNNSTGYRNVSFAKSIGKYLVQLQIDGRNKCLGKFDNLEEAAEFAKIKRKEIYGEFCGL